MDRSIRETFGGQGGDVQREGPIARGIERRTARVPSDVFLWGGVGSALAALGLMLAGKRTVATFVGQWVPTILLLGIYNKIVKVAGHDRQEPELH